MHYLSICAILQNESSYLDEWVVYHSLFQKVDHFYLYDNNSTDNLQEFVSQYYGPKIVTLESEPRSPCQFLAYNRCLKEHGHETKWLAFIDIDQFLYAVPYKVLQPGGETIHVMDMAQVLQNYESYPALAVHQLFFGSNGQDTRTPGGVLERFTARAAKPDPHVNSIVQPASTLHVGRDPHHFIFRNDGRAVDENGIVMPREYGKIESPCTCNRVFNAHFHTKSKEEHWRRGTRPSCSTGKMRDPQYLWDKHNSNEVVDTRLKDLMYGS